MSPTDAEPDPRDDGTRERLTERIAQQWAESRAHRAAAPSPMAAGPSNFSRAHVPWGVDLAAAWAWRVLVICAAGYLLMRGIAFFAVIVLPVVIALLITALVHPVVMWLTRRKVPRPAAAALVVVGGIATVAALLTVAGNQVATGANDLADSVAAGIGEIKDWLRTGPLNASDTQIASALERAQESVSKFAKEGDVLGHVTEIGTALGHVVAGFFIVLFSTYFFLADGPRIWAWFVRLAPRAGRVHFDGSGRVAWISLTRFVQATVIVAIVDSIGIMIAAAILQVPFVFAIGVLVFLGAFVPMVGATLAGTVAILVALVDQGPVTALFMLGAVIVVQQVEGHVLQPFLMGRFVSVHPLGVIVAIGCGVIVAGIAGALVAVPLAAAVNAVVQHLAANTSPGDDPEEQLEEDYAEEHQEPPGEVPDEPEEAAHE